MDVRDLSTHAPLIKGLGIEGATRPRMDEPSAVSSDAMNGRDSSDLSAAAQAMTHVMQMPEVRQDRVASLQQQIASENYHVDAQDVADAMLRSMAG